MQLKIPQIKQMRGIKALSQLNIICILCVIALSFIGCAAPKQAVKRRYFWPPLPDTPRIEWIGAYSGEKDFPRGGLDAFLESVAGTQKQSLLKPWGIATDGKGKVYVTDPQSLSIAVFDLNNKKVAFFVEEGLFKAPIGITLDGSGNIYVSDSNKNKIFVFTNDLRPLASFGGDDILEGPTGIAIDNERKMLYAVNSRKSNIAVFDLSDLSANKLLRYISRKGDKPGYLNYPTDIDIDSKGNLVVADSMNARVQVFDPDGKYIRKFGQRGDSPGDFQLIKGIAVDRKTDMVFVADGRGDKFLIFSKDGEALLTVGRTATVVRYQAAGGFVLPEDIHVDENGFVYVVDSINSRFQIFKIIDEDWLKENPIEMK